MVYARIRKKNLKSGQAATEDASLRFFNDLINNAPEKYPEIVRAAAELHAAYEPYIASFHNQQREFEVLHTLSKDDPLKAAQRKLKASILEARIDDVGDIVAGRMVAALSKFIYEALTQKDSKGVA